MSEFRTRTTKTYKLLDKDGKVLYSCVSVSEANRVFEFLCSRQEPVSMVVELRSYAPVDNAIRDDIIAQAFS